MNDYIIGYGSLLSAYSRQVYSGIHAEIQAVVAEGWKRGWTVRFRDEAATYAGVRRAPGAHLAAALIPIEMTEDLRHRERGYVFEPVDPADLYAPSGSRLHRPDGRFWIVVNREQVRADDTHPIPQSYVDTCLIGCLETGGEEMARDFIRDTELWDGHWIDDRDIAAPLYPRRAQLSLSQRAQIDHLLQAELVLGFRRGGSGA
jgi:hypothetical protein